jgi:hypothetical protein
MMAILQAILVYLLRSAGKAINTAFGWATVMLFGRVPQRRQIYLSLLALSSLVWLLTVLGIFFPGLATYLLAFVTLPDWFDRAWIRLAMFMLAAVLPAVLGYMTRFLVDKPQRPRSVKAQLFAVARGYLCAVGLGLTIAMMLIFAPALQLTYIVRRKSVSHVPVMIDAKDYVDVLSEIQTALRAGRVETVRRPASWLLRGPTWVLTVLAGGEIEKLVAAQLTELKSPVVQVLVHPSDLVLIGKEQDIARARAILSEHLTFSKAHLTWSKEGNGLEERLVRLAKRLERDEAFLLGSELRAVKRDLNKLRLSYEEWEVLFREILIIEREWLHASLQASADEVRAEHSHSGARAHR